MFAGAERAGRGNNKPTSRRVMTLRRSACDLEAATDMDFEKSIFISYR